MMRLFLRDSLGYLLLKAVVSLSWVISLKIFTAHLTPVEYGDYSVLTSLLLYGGVFATAWLIGPILRFYPAATDRSDFSGCVRTLILRSVLIGVPCFALALWILQKRMNLSIGIGLGSILVTSFVLNTYVASIFGYLRAKRAVGRYAKTYSIQILFGIALSTLFLKFFGLGILGIFLGQALALGLALWFLRDSNLVGISQKSSPLLKEMWRYGRPILFINLFTQILGTSDQLFLKWFNRGDEVGIYSANYMLAQNSIFAFTSIVSAATTPILFQHWEKGHQKETIGFLLRIGGLYCLVTVPFVVALSVFRTPISSWLIADAYRSGTFIIPIVSAGAFFVGLGNIFSEWMTLRKRTFDLMICYAVAAGVNLFSNWYFIPKFGIAGAAWTTFFSYLVLSFTILALFWTHYGKELRTDGSHA